MKFDPNGDPFRQLDQLIKEAADRGLTDANAMTLATVGENDKPSARVVLYKGLIRGGLSFYTNYDGRKGLELAHRPQASAVFFWPTLSRQIRVEGRTEKLTPAESDAYFQSRPRLSQIGAWASAQSQEIASFDVLRERIEAVEKRFAGTEVPRPEHWGGYLLIPENFEFWFGHEGRLHERYVFERQVGGDWRRFMRSP